MTYQIYYEGPNNNKRYTLFDIEYYLAQNEKSKEWYSEVHCLPLVEGIAYFLRDKFKDDNFNLEEFIKDSEEIQNVRGILYEHYDNRPKKSSDANHFHYHIFGNVLEEKIDSFAAKYNLFVNID